MTHKFNNIYFLISNRKKLPIPAIGGKKQLTEYKDALYGVNVYRQNKMVIPQVKAKVDKVNKSDFKRGRVRYKDEGGTFWELTASLVKLADYRACLAYR